MATLEIPSNVKCITSGQVPTTANLKDGEFAFGKVGGVAKLYGNVNGVIIDFTGDSSDVPSNINTFTEVNNTLTLTSSDTIHTLGDQLVALGQNVIRVKPDDTARTQVDRIMGNPSTDGPPSSYCDYWFKVLSEQLIYVFFGYSGRWGLVNYLYNASQSSNIAWSMSPRWMPIDPDSLEASVPDPLNVSRIQIGTLGSDNSPASYIDITSAYGIRYIYGESAPLSYALFHGGPLGNVKTLFGNQSIYGSGNIDLYRHCVKLIGSSLDCCFVVISSSNAVIDSLTDLFSVLKPIVGSDSSYPTNGRILYNSKYYTVTKIYPTSDGAVIANTADEEKWFGWSTLGTLTFYDNVTTV